MVEPALIRMTPCAATALEPGAGGQSTATLGSTLRMAATPSRLSRERHTASVLSEVIPEIAFTARSSAAVPTRRTSSKVVWPRSLSTPAPVTLVSSKRQHAKRGHFRHARHAGIGECRALQCNSCRPGSDDSESSPATVILVLRSSSRVSAGRFLR